MLRVLQAVTCMDRGGLETMLMNYYRHIDRTRVQFDFLTHRAREGAYDKEIYALGRQSFHRAAAKPVQPRIPPCTAQIFLRPPGVYCCARPS